MSIRQTTLAIICLTLFCGLISDAEEIRIVAESAPIKIGDDVIATAEKGDRFPVLERKGAWVAVRVATEQGPRAGWVLTNHVVSLVADDAPAPGKPKAQLPGIKVDLQLTQLTSGFGARPSYVTFQVEIGNLSEKIIHYDAAEISLEVDGQPAKLWQAKGGPTPSYSSSRVYTETTSARQRAEYVNSLDFLDAGDIAPGEMVKAWMRFEVPGLRTSRDAGAKTWKLSGTIDGQELSLDLEQIESEALAATLHPSAVDPSVRVIDVHSRLNALNVEALLEVAGSLPADNPGFVILVSDEPFILDDLASAQLRSLQTSLQRDGASIVIVFPEAARRSGYSTASSYSISLRGIPVEKTEAAAAFTVLGTRSDAPQRLARHLNSSDAVVRAAAARALAGHSTQSEAIALLVKAADDEETSVRSAALLALGGIAVRTSGIASRRSARVAASSDRSLVIKALVDATRDKDAAVRTSAARSAGTFQDQRIIAALLGLLDEPNLQVVSAACSSLGQLKAQDAVAKLQQIRSKEAANVQLKVAAINALESIGTLPKVDAAMARIDQGAPAYSDFTVLAEAKAKRSVPVLIAFLKSHSDSYNVSKVADVLGILGDANAVEPLIQLIGKASGREIPRALGRLGDKRAIEPLRELLKTTPSGSMRYATYEALIALEAPGALQEIAEELSRKRETQEAQGILRMLGQTGVSDVIPVVELYLDDQRNHLVATETLVKIDSPASRDPIQRRLRSKEYPFAEGVIGHLAKQKSHSAAELLKDAFESQNETVTDLARRHYDSLAQSLLATDVGRFRSLVYSKNFSAAEKAFQDTIGTHLKIVSGSPSLASLFSSNVASMLSAYRSTGKPELAATQVDKVVATLETHLKKHADSQLDGVLANLRGQQVILLAQAGQSDQASRLLEQQLRDATDSFESNPEKPGLALQLAATLKTQSQLFAEIAPRKQTDAAEQLLAFLLEQVTDKPQETQLVIFCIDSHVQQLGLLARSDPTAADQLLESFSPWMESLQTDDPAITGRIQSASRSLESIERAIGAGKARNSLIGKPWIPLEVDAWVNGAALKDEELRGKVVLLDFWAVWCGPCIATFPHLTDWQDMYHEDGLEIIGPTRYYSYDWDAASNRPVRVNGITPEQEQAATQKFAQHHKLKHRLAYVPAKSRLSERYGVTGIPHTVLIDRQGIVRLIRVGSGEANAQDIEHMIQQLLDGKCLRLDLKDMQVTDAELREHLEEQNEFEELNLYRTHISDEGLAALKELANLRYLRLGNTQIGDEGLLHLLRFRTLEELLLGNTKITSQGLTSLKDLNELRRLNLYRTDVDDVGINHLRGLTKLEVLNLHGTNVTDDGLKHLSQLQELINLDLGETKITDGGLAQLAGLTNLTRLVLGHGGGAAVKGKTNIDGTGLVHLQHMKEIKQLFLSDSHVDDVGLSQLPPLDSLEALYLNRTKITDAALMHIHKMKNLRTLHLSGTEVTDEGIAELEKHLPNCVIHQ